MRIPRKLLLNTTGYFHKTWRGHNREHVLRAIEDKLLYLRHLFDSMAKVVQGTVHLYSFCIMGNHVHECGRVLPDENGSFAKSIKILSRWMRLGHGGFGQEYNRNHDRQGKVAYDRPYTGEIENLAGVLRVMIYIDCNPVRAKLVKHPRYYPYSSFRFYAYGEVNRFTKHLTPPQCYLDLGSTPQERQKKYRELVDAYLRHLAELLEQGDDLRSEQQRFEARFIGNDLWQEKRRRDQREARQARGGPPIG